MSEGGGDGEVRFPPSEAIKSRFFFYLTKLNIKISPDVSIQNFLKSSKVAELSRKTYFEIKINKLEGVLLDLSESPEEFSRQLLIFSCYFHILFPSCT